VTAPTRGELSAAGIPTPGGKTPLQAFLDARGIPSARVESKGRFSRRQMARWRAGESDIRLRQMIRVLRTIRSITGERIQMHEIFALDPDQWPD
jgi:hypothetical protein